MPWELTGNAGINPNQNFLGTTDSQPLVIKTNGAERLRLSTATLIRGDVTVGAGSNGIMKVRHIEGKNYQDDTDDALYLNWISGRSVAVGQPARRSNLTVAGDVTVGAGSNGIMKVRHIEGKNYQDDTDDALYLNWISGRSVVIGERSRPASLEVTGDVLLTGADCAEEFDVIGAETVDPGTVVVLNDAGAVRMSDSAYDSRVAGVVSGARDYKPAVILDRRHVEASCRRPVALMGKVYCKVDASYGAISTGDLLTTSSTPGHAMRVVDLVRATGSIIGKALMPLRNGQDLIPVLVTLR